MQPSLSSYQAQLLLRFPCFRLKSVLAAFVEAALWLEDLSWVASGQFLAVQW